MHLDSKNNPNIGSFTKEDAFDFDDVLDLHDHDFKIAFAVEGFRSKDLKINPKFVKWVFRIYGKKEGKEYEQILPYHRCTDEDYDSFFPIQKNSKAALQQIRDGEDRDFLCIDWSDADPRLYGHYKDADY